jgi:hypothetical protein
MEETLLREFLRKRVERMRGAVHLAYLIEKELGLEEGREATVADLARWFGQTDQEKPWDYLMEGVRNFGPKLAKRLSEALLAEGYSQVPRYFTEGELKEILEAALVLPEIVSEEDLSDPEAKRMALEARTLWEEAAQVIAGIGRDRRRLGLLISQFTAMSEGALRTDVTNTVLDEAELPHRVVLSSPSGEAGG